MCFYDTRDKQAETGEVGVFVCFNGCFKGRVKLAEEAALAEKAGQPGAALRGKDADVLAEDTGDAGEDGGRVVGVGAEGREVVEQHVDGVLEVRDDLPVELDDDELAVGVDAWRREVVCETDAQQARCATDHACEAGVCPEAGEGVLLGCAEQLGDNGMVVVHEDGDRGQPAPGCRSGVFVAAWDGHGCELCLGLSFAGGGGGERRQTWLLFEQL